VLVDCGTAAALEHELTYLQSLRMLGVATQ